MVWYGMVPYHTTIWYGRYHTISTIEAVHRGSSARTDRQTTERSPRRHVEVNLRQPTDLTTAHQQHSLMDGKKLIIIMIISTKVLSTGKHPAPKKGRRIS
jgi:hypothetical protein